MAGQNMRGSQTGGRRNPADNLSREDRVRGGERSASMQNRDASGQFAGRKSSDRSASAGRGAGMSGSGRPGNH
jgi:hypothetical protein